MSDDNFGEGRCLCGAVGFKVTVVSQKLVACHCNMCRRWGGGPLFAVDCGTDVKFAGENEIGRFDSSQWAERGFCQRCGTHLFYHLKQSGQYLMPVGLFDDPQGIVFDSQVFVDEKPDYYSFSNVTHDMTGAEVFAKYAPPDLQQ